MPLLPNIFRGNRAPSFNSSPDSSSPATPASLPTPQRPFRRPLHSNNSSPSREHIKVLDYAPRTLLRPLPPTPELGPAANVVVIGADGRHGDPSTPPRHHHRSSSSPTPSKIPLPRSTVRSRSSTLNPSPRHPSMSPGASPSPSMASPSSKRRPIALKLRTSNLSPPPESPTASRSKATKMLSFIPEVPEATPASTRPPSQSDIEPDSTAGPFHNVPLPWSAVPIASLRSNLGPVNFDQLIDYTIKSLMIDNVRLLAPNILTTAASEDARLRAELDRLRGKYQSTTRQRDRAVAELEALAINGELRSVLRTLGGLKKLSQRCDRLAKQIFICNDQIRQIEIQGEEHIIGALRFAIDNPYSLKLDSFQTIKRQTLEVNVQEVTVGDSTPSPGPDSAGTAEKCGSGRQVHFEPLFEHLRAPGFLDSRPTSVGTILSLGLGNLGFPLPPSRSDGDDMSDGSPRSQIDAVTATIPDEPTTAKPLRPKSLTKAASTNNIYVLVRQSDHSVDGHDESQEITIYPPGHKRSESAPLLGALDLPHTPWLPQMPTMATSSNGEPTGTRTPSTFLSRLGSSLFRQPGVEQHGPTAPLKVKGGRANGRVTKAKSMVAGSSPISDATRRARKGRDTQLETPESILWGLATAELWTKGIGLSPNSGGREAFDKHDLFA